MTTPVIIDAIVVIVLVAFTVHGARQGLLRALAGLVIIVVALVGAGMVTSTFSGPAAKLAAPFIEEHIALKVEDVLAARNETTQSPEGAEVFQIEDLLALLGLDEEVRGSMALQAQEAVRDTGAAIATAVVESVARSFIYGLLYILSFVALMLLLHVLLKAMDLIMKLPGLHGLNALGGGLLGLIEGALLLFLAVWVLRRLGISFETDLVREAHILRIFTTHTPLSVLSFLQ